MQNTVQIPFEEKDMYTNKTHGETFRLQWQILFSFHLCSQIGRLPCSLKNSISTNTSLSSPGPPLFPPTGSSGFSFSLWYLHSYSTQAKRAEGSARALHCLQASCSAVFWTALHSSLRREPDLESLKQHKCDVSPSVILGCGTWPLSV